MFVDNCSNVTTTAKKVAAAKQNETKPSHCLSFNLVLRFSFLLCFFSLYFYQMDLYLDPFYLYLTQSCLFLSLPKSRSTTISSSLSLYKFISIFLSYFFRYLSQYSCYLYLLLSIFLSIVLPQSICRIFFFLTFLYKCVSFFLFFRSEHLLLSSLSVHLCLFQRNW